MEVRGFIHVSFDPEMCLFALIAILSVFLYNEKLLMRFQQTETAESRTAESGIAGDRGSRQQNYRHMNCRKQSCTERT